MCMVFILLRTNFVMRTHSVICFSAAIVFALLIASGASAENESAAGGAGICEGCSSAVGTVNVTLVEPPPFSGMFLSAFDFGALADALSAFLSAVSSALLPA